MVLWHFISERWPTILSLTGEHVLLVLVAMVVAIILGVVLGVAVTYWEPGARAVLYLCQILMTVPSMAMFGILLPLLGIGYKTGVVALILYALLPVVRNTYTGIRAIDPAVLEAAKGMGLREWSILRRIKLPLIIPVVMAGIRTATVMIVGIAAIAAFIGAGGLGELIFRGISRYNRQMILAGAIFISALAICFDLILKQLEYRYGIRS